MREREALLRKRSLGVPKKTKKQYPDGPAIPLLSIDVEDRKANGEKTPALICLWHNVSQQAGQGIKFNVHQNE